MSEIPEAAIEAARDALFRGGDNLARWCGMCSGEMCDDCIAIRDDAARAALTSAMPVLEAQWREQVARVIDAHDPHPHENWCRVCDDGEPYGEHVARLVVRRGEGE